MTMSSRLIPFALPESQTFWDGTAEEKLLLQQCSDCYHKYFPPAPVCPNCSSRAVESIQASGRATLYSYVISAKPWPQWGIDGPMSVALVDLEEGPRMLSTIVDCPQTRDALVLDMSLELTFRRFGDDGPNMPCYRPSGRADREAK